MSDSELAGVSSVDGGRGRLDFALRYFTDEERFPHAALALQTVAALALFGVLERVFCLCARLPVDVYYAPVMFFQALRHPAPLAVLALAVVLLLYRRRLGWDQFELHRQVRWLAAIMAIVLAFAFSTYDYNYFYDQAHLVDRLLLVGLALLVAWHPAVVGLFLLQAFVVTGQFSRPLYFSWTDKMMVYQLLILLVAVLVLKLFYRRLSFAPFLVAAICVVAIFYFRPAVGKLELGWLSRNDQANIFMAAVYQNGWLGWLGEDGIARVYSLIERWQFPLMVITLLLELGVVLMLLNVRLTVALLAGCVLMHAGIFLSSGILFWKWMVVDVALAVVLLTLHPSVRQRIFNWRMTVVGAAIVLVLQVAYRQPVKLAWYDTPLCFHFHLEAIGESGKVYEIPPYQMAPYDFPFSQGRFYFLTDDIEQVVNCLGAVDDAKLLEIISASSDAADVVQLRAEHGRLRYNEQQVGAFEEMLRRYCQPEHWQRTRNPLPRFLKAPMHIWTGAHEGDGLVYQGQEPVREVRVRLMEAFVHKGEITPVEDRVVSAFATLEGNGTTQRPTATARRSEAGRY